MRHLLLALMIVLLPLRGWMGDAMATEMASGAAVHLQTATKKVADHVHQAGAAPHFDHVSSQAEAPSAESDCSGHDAANGTSVADTHCATCTVCQACHTVALSPAAAHGVAVLSPPALQHSPAAQFASAVAALGQKPPIS